MHTEYHANNSGGDWWLTDEDWYKLEEAGWEVEWFKNDPSDRFAVEGRFLGALAMTALRRGLPYEKAIEEWERVTGQSADEKGCPCCGAPHYFYEEADE